MNLKKVRKLLVAAVAAMGIGSAFAADKPAVTYLDWNESKNDLEEATITDYEDVTTNTTVFSGGKTYYLGSGTVAIDGRIEVTGTAKLIIATNACLNAKRGIHLPTGKKLTVCGLEPYSYPADTLKALDSIPDSVAGIGGNNGESCGELVIAGGQLSVCAGNNAAAIGGGKDGTGGTVKLVAEFTVVTGETAAVTAPIAQADYEQDHSAKYVHIEPAPIVTDPCTLTVPTVVHATAVVTKGGRPVSDLTKIQKGSEVVVTWTADEGYMIAAGAIETIVMAGNKTAKKPKVDVKKLVTTLEPWFDYCELDPVEDEIATNGVSLTGGKECAAGTVLKLNAKAPKAVKARGDEWVFAGWYSEKGAPDSALNNGTQDWRLASGYKFTSLTNDVTIFARFVPKSEEAKYAKVECFTSTEDYETGVEISPSIPVVATAYTLPKVKVSGLPSGLKFTDKDVFNKTNLIASANTIYGTPTKSGVYTALVTMTTAGKATATTSVKFVVRKEDELKVDVDYDATKGKVTGMGVYAGGKKVTLKATANKGYVFTGWWEGDERKSQAASYVIDEMPTNDVKMAAKFITKAVYDKETDTWTGDDVVTDVAFQGWAGEDLKPGETNTWYQGVKVPASKVGVANFNSQTPCSISASGLPSGVKFDKDNRCFTGVPTKAGLFKVTFSFKNASGAQKFVQMVEVEELPVWTIGNFDGSFIGVDVEVAEGVTNRYTGMTTFTVGKTGKISGTANTDLGKIKFSAASFDRVDLDGGTPEAYWVDLEGSLSYNKKTVKVPFAANVKISGTTGLGVIGYNGDKDCAVQNPWKNRMDLDYPSFPTSPALSLTEDKLVLKFGAKGVVKVSGKVPGDNDATVSVSGSSQVQPAQWNGNVLTAYVEVFVAPKNGLANGFFKEYEIELTSDGNGKFESVKEGTLED